MRAVEWLQLIIAALVGVGGGQGLAALFRARSDKRAAETEVEITEETAVSTQLLALIDKQAQVIVSPLESRLKQAEEKIEELEERIRRKDAEYEALKTRYWRAIQLVREMRHWFEQNCGAATSVTFPAPHPSIADDI